VSCSRAKDLGVTYLWATANSVACLEVELGERIVLETNFAKEAIGWESCRGKPLD